MKINKEKSIGSFFSVRFSEWQVFTTKKQALTHSSHGNV